MRHDITVPLVAVLLGTTDTTNFNRGPVEVVIRLTITNDIPYLALMGELWGVFRELKNHRDISRERYLKSSNQTNYVFSTESFMILLKSHAYSWLQYREWPWSTSVTKELLLSVSSDLGKNSMTFAFYIYIYI